MIGRITDQDYILGFLRNESPDFKGRFYKETLEWTNFQLEQCHDQVQHIFPLHEDSRMASNWPILTEEIVKQAREDESILSNVKAAKDRFERFLGIGAHEDHGRQNLWCRPNNHNLLRITRIIRSLRLFGLDQDAQDFYDAAMKAGNRCGIYDNTRTYWKKALTENIWETLQA